MANRYNLQVKIGECAICMDKIRNNNDNSRPKCCENHFFHHDCLMKWSKEKNTCPLDYQEFTAIIDSEGRAHPVAKVRNISISLVICDAPSLSQYLKYMIVTFTFKCGICGELRGDLERAQTDVCGHNFHRQCLVESARSRNVCPVQTCKSEFSEIECEFGEVIPIADLRRSPSCECEKNRRRPIREETAMPNDCKHRFERHWLRSATQWNHHCPLTTCNSHILFLKCDKGERIVIKNSIKPYRCFICTETDREKESARISPCGHQFHRHCILGHYRRWHTCPLCKRMIAKMYCQFGDTFEKEKDLLSQMMGRFRLKYFQCAFCCTSNLEGPLSKLDCGCEFHSACIEEFTSQQSQRLCLNCDKPYTTITSILDNFCNLENKSPVSNEEWYDEQASSDAMSNSEANVTAAFTLDDRMYSKIAVGGVDVHMCTLRDSEIPADDATHSKGYSHWYHRVCMQILSGELFGLEDDLDNTVDEFSRINIRDEFPRVSSRPTWPGNKESDPFERK